MSGPSRVRASILVPTHDRPETLPLSIGSALAQTVDDLEVLIIGDGMTAEARAAAIQLAVDPRVRVLDLPKGEHHGETHRHEAILAARSNAIMYLCDDDLLLPDHVESLLGLLEDHTFVQSLNGYVTTEGVIRRYPGSLADPRHVESVIRPVPLTNFVSITGTAHRRDFYLESGEYWSTTPAGDWPDRYQWAKLLPRATFSGATSRRMTALQFPATDAARAGWSREQALVELQRWSARLSDPDFAGDIDTAVAAGTERDLFDAQHAAADAQRRVEELQHAAADARRREEDLQRRAEELQNSAARFQQEAADARRVAADAVLEAERLEYARSATEAELLAHHRTLSWRLTRPLRAIRRVFR